MLKNIYHKRARTLLVNISPVLSGNLLLLNTTLILLVKEKLTFLQTGITFSLVINIQQIALKQIGLKLFTSIRPIIINFLSRLCTFRPKPFYFFVFSSPSGQKSSHKGGINSAPNPARANAPTKIKDNIIFVNPFFNFISSQFLCLI